jgi:hypothetical protein
MSVQLDILYQTYLKRRELKMFPPHTQLIHSCDLHLQSPCLGTLQLHIFRHCQVALSEGPVSFHQYQHLFPEVALRARQEVIFAVMAGLLMAGNGAFCRELTVFFAEIWDFAGCHWKGLPEEVSIPCIDVQITETVSMGVALQEFGDC